jgi:DNA-binding transcriptional ArsR family regulator
MIRDAKDLRRAASIFKALSNPNRLQIICLLSEGPPTTQKELVEVLGWPQSTMSQHLTALRERGLVVAKRQGRELHLMNSVCDWVPASTDDSFSFLHRLLTRHGRQSTEP